MTADRDAWDEVDDAGTEPAKTCATCGDTLGDHEAFYVPIAGSGRARVWCIACYEHRRRYGSARLHGDRYEGEDAGDDRFEDDD